VDYITIRWNEFVLLMIIRYKNEFMLKLLLFINNTHAKFATDNWLKHNHWYDYKIEEYLDKLGY
jgi:hypothetical protein